MSERSRSKELRGSGADAEEPMLRPLRGVQSGAEEPVLRQLPQRVLHDLGRRGTESALLWNRIYARATPHIALADLLELPRLWGSSLAPIDDHLEPYYWGFNLAGQRMDELDAASSEVDGPGASTEVDLFLLGSSELLLIEAKTNASPGRCSRYAGGRCPEIHGAPSSDAGASLERGSNQPAAGGGEPATVRGRRALGGHETPDLEPCRYWEAEQARFSHWLDFGPRPAPETAAPPCDRHYQLGRTLLLGLRLAERLNRRMHLWLLLPERRWSQLQPTWLDFVERVRPAELWRRMRVISWEALGSLQPR